MLNENKKIVKKILAAAIERHDLECDIFQYFEIQYGRKKIILNFNKKYNKVRILINNFQPEKFRLINETTLIYLAARNIIEQIANSRQKIVVYKLLTENDKIQKWAKTKGKSVFKWQRIAKYQRHFRPSLHVFQTEIFPIISKKGGGIMGDLNIDPTLIKTLIANQETIINTMNTIRTTQNQIIDEMEFKPKIGK